MSIQTYNDRLLERRKGMTDRDVFTSPRLSDALFKVGQFMSDRYGSKRSIRVRLVWLDNDVVAYTDNKVLTINVNNPFCVGVLAKIRLLLIKGLFAHEMGHVLYTDFDMSKDYDDTLKRGLWYPCAPKTYNEDDEKTILEIQSYLEDAERNGIIRNMLHQLSNILEDGYIETKILANYRGILGYALRLVRERHKEEMPSLSEQIEQEKEGRSPYISYCQMILEYAKFGTITLGDADVDDEHLRFLYPLLDLIDESLSCTAERRLDIVNTLFVKLWPYAKDYIRQMEEEAALREELNQLFGSSPDTSGDTAPVDSGESAPSSSVTSRTRSKTKEILSKSVKSAKEDDDVSDDAASSKSSGSIDDKKDDAKSGAKSKQKSKVSTSETAKDKPVDTENTASVSSADETAENSDHPAFGPDGSDEEETSTVTESSDETNDDGDADSSSPSGDADDGSSASEDTENSESSNGDADSAADETAGETDDADMDSTDETGDKSDAESDGSGDTDACEDDADDELSGDTSVNSSESDSHASDIHAPDEFGSHDGESEVFEDEDYDTDYFEGRASSEINDIIEHMAAEAVNKEIEMEKEHALNAEASSIDYGAAHRGINVYVHRQSTVDAAQIMDYDDCAAPLLEISKELQRSVSQEIQDRQTGGRLNDLYFGKKFDVRKVYRNDGRFFYKENLPQDIPDLAIGILVDESGSMSGYQRDIYARATAIILYDFCKGLDIPVCIYGHSTETVRSGYEDVSMYSYAEFDSVDDSDAYRLMKIKAKRNNRDAMALRFVAEHLMARPEEEKMLIIISDGQPAAWNYYGEKACEELSSLAAEYVRMGIKFVAAAIGNDKPQISEIYGDAFLNISNLDELPELLTRIIKQQLPVFQY